MGTDTVWPAESLWESIAPTLPGFTVEVLAQLDSSNTELMRRARAGVLEPTLLVAERQTAGRGRLGRSWESGEAPSASIQGDSGACVSLTFSLGLLLKPSDWSGLSLAVGLSVAQSLHPALRLKWPNDIWLDGRKLAGILIETAGSGDGRYAVIGIGINILPRSAQGLRTPPAALSELLPQTSAPAALASIVPALVRTLQQFEVSGFAPFRAAFHARDLLLGQDLVCTDGTEGIARGVDATGALQLQTAAGLKTISSSEVSVRPRTPPGGPAPAWQSGFGTLV
ncbi:MAG: biotin--[acetyl-CoA-carboxylase] ligase [Rhodoferax sp.]|nr:biotin--[acetyl-CoA-carboxylase] ligase [Rhodoferax sp.]